MTLNTVAETYYLFSATDQVPIAYSMSLKVIENFYRFCMATIKTS